MAKTPKTETAAKRPAAKAKAMRVPSRRTAAVERVSDYVSPATIRQTWEPWRANRIISIMRNDGISYDRAVKRSRRRMINEGKWA